MTEEERRRDALIGTVDVRLTTGETLHLRPFGVKSMHRVVARVKLLFGLYSVTQSDSAMGLGDLLEASYEEICKFVSEVLDKDYDEIYSDDFPLEDLIDILSGLIEVNFTNRPGLVKAAGRLWNQVEQVLPDTEEKETPQETETPEETTTQEAGQPASNT